MVDLLPSEDRHEEDSDEEMSETRRKLRELDAKMVEEGTAQLFGTGRGKGKTKCPAKDCLMGSSIGGGPCAVCEGAGTVPCAPCEDDPGSLACVRCDEDGLVMRSCEDCAGTGHLPDLDLAVALATCRWCLGTSARSCLDCNEEGKVEAACIACLATGEQTCESCAGKREVRCSSCKGEGRVQHPKNKKRTQGCKPCKRKGVAACGACRKSGKEDCTVCKGERKARFPCPTCSGDRSTACMGCFRGRYRQWEVTAASFEAAGRREDALEHWRHARLRAESCYARWIKLKLDDVRTDDQLRELERAELKRLNGEIDRVLAEIAESESR